MLLLPQCCAWPRSCPSVLARGVDHRRSATMSNASLFCGTLEPTRMRWECGQTRLRKGSNCAGVQRCQVCAPINRESERERDRDGEKTEKERREDARGERRDDDRREKEEEKMKKKKKKNSVLSCTRSGTCRCRCFAHFLTRKRNLENVRSVICAVQSL